MTRNREFQAAMFGTVVLLFGIPTFASASEATAEAIKLTFVERLFDVSEGQTDMMPVSRENTAAVIGTGHGTPIVRYRTYYKVPGAVSESMSAQEPVHFHAGFKGGPR